MQLIKDRNKHWIEMVDYFYKNKVLKQSYHNWNLKTKYAIRICQRNALKLMVISSVSYYNSYHLLRFSKVFEEKVWKCVVEFVSISKKKK